MVDFLVEETSGYLFSGKGYLDDERPIPDGWIAARWLEELRVCLTCYLFSLQQKKATLSHTHPAASRRHYPHSSFERNSGMLQIKYKQDVFLDLSTIVN